MHLLTNAFVLGVWLMIAWDWAYVWVVGVAMPSLVQVFSVQRTRISNHNGSIEDQNFTLLLKQNWVNVTFKNI